MLHSILQLGIAAPLLGTLGLLLTDISTVERVATPVSTQLVDAVPAAKGEPPSERVSLRAKSPCSVASSQGETDTAPKNAQPDSEFDEPFHVTLNSLNYIDRATGTAPIHHFIFNNSSALKISAKVDPKTSIAGTYAVALP